MSSTVKHKLWLFITSQPMGFYYSETNGLSITRWNVALDREDMRKQKMQLDQVRS